MRSRYHDLVVARRSLYLGLSLAALLAAVALGACAGDESGIPAVGGAGGAAAHAGTGGAAAGGGQAGSPGTGGAGASGGSAGAGGVLPSCTVDVSTGGGGASGGSSEAGVCESVAECLDDYAPVPGPCAGPAEIQCCIYTGGVCNPDAGPEPNVGLEEAPGVGGCPPGMIPVTTFCIDRYEASLMYADSGVPFSPYVNPGTIPVRAVSIAGAVPQGYIDQLQAGDACAAAGKRLCTDPEWLRACQGPAATTYPYGDTLEPGVCNDARAVHPAIEYFGTTADWIWSELGNACLNQLHDSLDPAGANPGCVTDEGAFDMMGNLHEWTDDPAGTFRGGYYVDTVLNGPGCLYATTAHNVYHWDYSTGFRCCADP